MTGEPRDPFDLRRFVKAQRGTYGRVLDEARAYLARRDVSPRLVACAEAVLEIRNRTAVESSGFPDDLKLCSSATLFACASPPGSVFTRLLDRYFEGGADAPTLAGLGREASDGTTDPDSPS